MEQICQDVNQVFVRLDIEAGLIVKDRKLNNLHKFVGRAGRPSHKNHEIVSYLILIPNYKYLQKFLRVNYSHDHKKGY